MYEYYIDTGYLEYILTFKFSQDPLENMFSTIRGSLGYNNNPTVAQVCTFYENFKEGFFLLIIIIDYLYH